MYLFGFMKITDTNFSSFQFSRLCSHPVDRAIEKANGTPYSSVLFMGCTTFFGNYIFGICFPEPKSSLSHWGNVLG